MSLESQAFSSINSKIDELEKLFIPKKPFAFSLAPETITIFSMAKYLEDDLKCILNIVLDIRTFLASALLEKLHKKILKARFLGVYCGKTNLKCYNFY